MTLTRARWLLIACAGLFVSVPVVVRAEKSVQAQPAPQIMRSAPPRLRALEPKQLVPTGDGPTPEEPLVFGRRLVPPDASTPGAKENSHADAPSTASPAPAAHKASASQPRLDAAHAKPIPAQDLTRAHSDSVAVPGAPITRLDPQAVPAGKSSQTSAASQSAAQRLAEFQAHELARQQARDREGAALARLRDRLIETMGKNSKLAAKVEVDQGAVKIVARSSAHAPRQSSKKVSSKQQNPSQKGPEHKGPSHWSYEGATGPAHWAELDPAWASCGAGKRQSPIDIRGGLAVDLPAIDFDYRPSGLRVTDNGHTIRADVGDGLALRVLGRRYRLRQFHFHRPAEMWIDGRQFDMVAHLVHEAEGGQLAVVAVLFEIGDAQTPRNPVVQTVWNNLPLERKMQVPVPEPVDIISLLPPDRRYYTFMGSLTTPPCTEGVLWMVMREPIRVPPSQVDVLAYVYPMNARPVQPVAGRLIKQSE